MKISSKEAIQNTAASAQQLERDALGMVQSAILHCVLHGDKAILDDMAVLAPHLSKEGKKAVKWLFKKDGGLPARKGKGEFSESSDYANGKHIKHLRKAWKSAMTNYVHKVIENTEGLQVELSHSPDYEELAVVLKQHDEFELSAMFGHVYERLVANDLIDADAVQVDVKTLTTTEKDVLNTVKMYKALQASLKGDVPEEIKASLQNASSNCANYLRKHGKTIPA